MNKRQIFIRYISKHSYNSVYNSIRTYILGNKANDNNLNGNKGIGIYLKKNLKSVTMINKSSPYIIN